MSRNSRQLSTAAAEPPFQPSAAIDLNRAWSSEKRFSMLIRANAAKAREQTISAANIVMYWIWNWVMTDVAVRMFR